MRGKKAPDFTLTTIDGKWSPSATTRASRLGQLLGYLVRRLQARDALVRGVPAEVRPQGFEILGIAQDDAPKDEIDKIAKRINVSYPILFPDAKVTPAYGGVAQ